MEPTPEYLNFVKEIKEQIRQSQDTALKQVNKELIRLYFYIGEKIVAKQEVHNWGKSIVQSLADDLQKEFPGTQGFSSRNLWRMRNMLNTARMKNCHHWWQKLDGLIMCSFSKNVRMIWNANIISRW